jgi:endonuclease/exonuclease/phosphatase family metal-dependent hydrolase
VKERVPLRIMSYNIRFNTEKDAENAWPYRKDNVASLVRFHEPDSLGVQEALKDQIDDLAERLPQYTWVGEGREGGEQGEYNAIFYHRERLELLKEGTFWLSETPNVAAPGWDAQLPRIVTWARFRDQRSDGGFFHFNTHFDHFGSGARTESARLLSAMAASIAGDAPVVVTGDFNFIESIESYSAMTESFQDAYYLNESSNHGPKGTFVGFRVTQEPGIRIDYVFVKNKVRVRKYGVLTEQWHGRYPSDHLPLLVEIVLDEQRPV